MAHYSNFVFYGSWRDTLEGFKEDFGKDYAYETLWNLMLMATAGDVETDKQSIMKWIRGSVMPNVDNAKARFDGANVNGKKGGRPGIEVDLDLVKELRDKGESWQYIATYLTTLGTKISAEGLRKKYKAWEETSQQTNKQTNQQQPQTK